MEMTPINKKGDVIKIVGRVIKPIKFCIWNSCLYRCKPLSRKRAHPVFLTRNEVIPPHSEMILPVKTLIQGKNILMEPCGQFEQKFNITMGCSVKKPLFCCQIKSKIRKRGTVSLENKFWIRTIIWPVRWKLSCAI